MHAEEDCARPEVGVACGEGYADWGGGERRGGTGVAVPIGEGLWSGVWERRRDGGGFVEV